MLKYGENFSSYLSVANIINNCYGFALPTGPLDRKSPGQKIQYWLSIPAPYGRLVR